MKSKKVFIQPFTKQLFDALDETSDSQEPPSAVGNGEQSPCTPTEAGGRFSFNENIFATPKLCPPTPTKTPATATLKPSSSKTLSSLKSPLFDSESEESDNDENKFVIKSPISIKARPNRFQVLGSTTKPRSPLMPVQPNLPPHRDFSQIKLGKQKPKRPSFSLVQQSTSDDEIEEELTPPGICKKRPFDAIRSPVTTKSSTSSKPSSLLGGTPNFDFPDLSEADRKVFPPPNKKTAGTTFMDISGDFNSPGMCPPSTIKPKYTNSSEPMSSNWFASPSLTKSIVETPQIEMTPPSPVLFQSSNNSKGNFFSNLSQSTLDSPGNPFETEIFQTDFDEAVIDCSDDMISDDDNASMEDFGDMSSQMQASTPPRATLSQTSPNALNVQLIPGRLTANEDVHENPFSPERNFKKTKTEDDYFSITDDKNTSSYLQGKIASCKKSARKKRQSDMALNISDVNNLSEVDPIFEVYFSRYLEDFEETGVLGDGCFGRVTKAKNRFDGITYAIKSMKRKIKGKKDLDKILKEVQALATLVDNPYLVRYYSCWIEGKLPQFSLFLQTELCEGGSLAKRIGKQIFNESQLIDLTRQLASGLMQMHAQNIVHLDLKPDNIYLTSADDDKPRYKIGDLGLASSSLETLKDVMEGDSRYLAKELLSTEENVNTDLTKADIFSLGATIYECAIGRPLPNNGNEWHDIRNGILKDFPNHFTDSFKNLLLAMLNIQPTCRPTAYQLLQHPLFTQQKLTENDLLQTIQHQQNIIIKLKEQEAILRRKIEEMERK